MNGVERDPQSVFVKQSGEKGPLGKIIVEGNVVLIYEVKKEGQQIFQFIICT
jgi:hypothetical protein